MLRPRGQSSFLPSREHSGCSATSRGGLREMGGQSQQEISDGGDLIRSPAHQDGGAIASWCPHSAPQVTGDCWSQGCLHRAAASLGGKPPTLHPIWKGPNRWGPCCGAAVGLTQTSGASPQPGDPTLDPSVPPSTVQNFLQDRATFSPLPAPCGTTSLCPMWTHGEGQR